MENKPETALVTPDCSKYGVEKGGAEKVDIAFMPTVTVRKELEEQFAIIYPAGIAEDNLERAVVLAKALVGARKSVEKTHKSQKAMALAFGRYVDAWKKAETETIVQMEAKIKEITQYHANLEKDRKAKLLADRMAISEPLDSQATHMRLGEMSEEVFESYYNSIVLADEARKKRATDEEEARVAKEKEEREERERVAKENAQLKAAAEERDKREAAERAEREAVEKKRVAAEEKRQKEDSVRLAKIESERAKEREVAAAKLAAERAEREQIEAKQKEKDDADEKEAKVAPTNATDPGALLELIRGGYKSALGGRGEDHTVTIFFEEGDYLAAEALHNAITGNSNAGASLRR